jgi:hypothetical protein
MSKGTVKWYNESKGFGFIARAELSRRIRIKAPFRGLYFLCILCFLATGLHLRLTLGYK